MTATQKVNLKSLRAIDKISAFQVFFMDLDREHSLWRIADKYGAPITNESLSLFEQSCNEDREIREPYLQQNWF